jgi:hypothetical protein
MKKLTLSFCLLLVTASDFAQTNVYYHFPDSNAVWREFSYNYIPFSSNESCSNYQNVIDGDTMAGSFIYHKIRHSGNYFASGYCNAPPWYYTPSYQNYYLGAYREDTTNRKVFFLPPGSISDTLLYNFNLSVGDTLPVTYTNDFFVSNIVTSIDSILIGSKYHKRFGISGYGFDGFDTNYVYLIEGIGSTYGLLGRLQAPAEVPGGSILECFMQNGITLFPDTNTLCQLVSLNVNELKNPIRLIVFPNPFSTTTTLQTNINLKSATLSIYNALGQEIKTINNISGKEITLQRDNLPEGIYFIRLTEEDKIVGSGKIIVE